MKKSIIILAAMAAAAFGVEAKTVDQLRIYINPGHGSYTGNDRPMNTIRDVDGTLTVINPNTEDNNNTPDTTAFYESNTNLQKASVCSRSWPRWALSLSARAQPSNPTAQPAT